MPWTRWVAWGCIVVGFSELVYGFYQWFDIRQTTANTPTAFVLFAIGCLQLATLESRVAGGSRRKHRTYLWCAVLSGCLGVAYIVAYPQSIPGLAFRWVDGAALVAMTFVAVLSLVRSPAAP